MKPSDDEEPLGDRQIEAGSRGGMPTGQRRMFAEAWVVLGVYGASLILGLIALLKLFG